MTHLEGSQRTNQDSLVSKLSSRIQELEEKLQGEEQSASAYYYPLYTFIYTQFVFTRAAQANPLDKSSITTLDELPVVVGVRVCSKHTGGVEWQEAAAAMWSPDASAHRDNNSLQQANRKLERRVKEMKMQADEEQVNLQSQRDQVDTRMLFCLF